MAHLIHIGNSFGLQIPKAVIDNLDLKKAPISPLKLQTRVY